MAHIQHLIEDRDITLGTIKDIVSAVEKGELVGATEKLDGVNIMFTCMPNYEARFARSESDIRARGMSRAVLEAKYTGRGLVQETFVKGSNALAALGRELSLSELRKTFADGALWYSAEIVYTKNPNVVQYAHDGVVLHERPVLRFDGMTLSKETQTPFSTLESRLVDANESPAASGWRFHGPQRVVVPIMKESVWAKEVIEAAKEYGSDADTLDLVLRKHAREQLSALGVVGVTLDRSIERLVEAPGCPSLTELRSKLPQKAVTMLRESSDWATRTLWHLDLAITRFATAALASLTSSLVVDNNVEARRIDERLTRSVALIEQSGNPEAIKILRKQVQKLDRIVTPVEGIVFPWGEKLYKLTGAFAPANAIMGLCKYGRGKAIPPIGG